jgi:putative iron-dependent peroxidase
VRPAEAVGAFRRQPAFTYRGGRDITGFVDGTAIPPVRRAADVALVGPGSAGQAGSHVLPFGTAEEHGVYFVAFSAQRSRYDRMLARMLGTAGDGVRDRLTDFSRPVSGAYCSAPSLDALDVLAGPDVDR